MVDKASIDKASIYDELTPAGWETIAASEAEIAAVNRSDTEGTFRIGDALRMAQAVFKETSFLKWCKLNWKKDRTYAHSLIRVSRVLAADRERLVAARVPRTALIHLSSSPDHVEQVLEIIEAGEVLRVKDVKSIIAGGPNASKDAVLAFDRGGPVGFRALHREKGKLISVVIARLAWIVGQVEEALEPTLQGKRVLKGELAEKIVIAARRARHEIESLCLFVEPYDVDPTSFRTTVFPKGSQWSRLWNLLFRMGGKDNWPASTDLEEWLRKEVLPLLNWAVGNEAAEAPQPREQTESQPDPVLTEEVGVEGGPELSGAVIAAAAEHPDMESLVRSALQFDWDRYRIPPEDLVDGLDYEVKLAGNSTLSEARLHDDAWVRGNVVIAARDEVTYARVSEKTVRTAIDFLVFMRAHGRRMGEGADVLDRVQQEIAAALADLLVCLGASRNLKDRSVATRSVIRDALHEDSIMAEAQQRMLGSGALGASVH